MNEYRFNLLDEPWIHCIDTEGQQVTIGMKALFERADSLLTITDQNPLVELSITRILLAVIHSAVSGPKDVSEWMGIYMPGRFDSRITDYLERFRHRFDLFASDYPFYQTPGLFFCEKNDPGKPVQGMPVSGIILGRASGNNLTLFDHTTDNMELAVSPAEAARALVTAQMFSFGATCRKTTNYYGYLESYKQAALTKGIHITLSGRNLFETLMLNLLIYYRDDPIPCECNEITHERLDRPVWEENDPTLETGVERPPKGYLEYLTCKCRHVLLVPEREEDTVVVKRLYMAQGKAFHQVINPMSVRKANKKGRDPSPRDLEVERMVWRDSQSLFAVEPDKADLRPLVVQNAGYIISRTQGNGHRAIPRERRFICAAYGIANNQANPLAWRKEEMNVPVAVLSGDLSPYLLKGTVKVDTGEKAIKSGIGAFLKAYGDKKRRTLMPGLAGEALRYYWDEMEGHFHEFMVNLTDNGAESALVQWTDNIVSTAREALTKTLKDRYHDSYRAWVVAIDKLNLELKRLDS